MRCLLVDKIIACEPGVRIAGIKNVTLSEDFLQDHFPGFPVMPGVLQVEAVVQLASWLAFATSGGASLLELAGIQSIKFREFIVPGDQMRMEVTVLGRDDTGMVCNAAVSVNDVLKTDMRRIALALADVDGEALRPLVLTGQVHEEYLVALAFLPVEACDDPAAVQAHFDFISGRAPFGRYQQRSSRDRHRA